MQQFGIRFCKQFDKLLFYTRMIHFQLRNGLVCVLCNIVVGNIERTATQEYPFPRLQCIKCVGNGNQFFRNGAIVRLLGIAAIGTPNRLFILADNCCNDLACRAAIHLVILQFALVESLRQAVVHRLMPHKIAHPIPKNRYDPAREIRLASLEAERVNILDNIEQHIVDKLFGIFAGDMKQGDRFANQPRLIRFN